MDDKETICPWCPVSKCAKLFSVIDLPIRIKETFLSWKEIVPKPESLGVD